MPVTLRKVTFSADRLAEVEKIDCGEEEWSREAERWIKGIPGQCSDCALGVIELGTDVWLYKTEDGQLVGFGAVGPRDWRLPKPKDKPKRISTIPWVAIQKKFRKKPEGASPGEWFSGQILDDLINEARGHPEREPFVGLCVHPNNLAAIKVYERAGFAKLAKPYKEPVTGLIYDRMLLEL